MLPCLPAFVHVLSAGPLSSPGYNSGLCCSFGSLSALHGLHATHNTTLTMTAVVQNATTPLGLQHPVNGVGVSKVDDAGACVRPKSQSPAGSSRLRKHRRYYMPEGNIVIQVRVLTMWREFTLIIMSIRSRTHSSDLILAYCMRTRPSYGVSCHPSHRGNCLLLVITTSALSN